MITDHLYDFDHQLIDITTDEGKARAIAIWHDPARTISTTVVRRWGALRPWQKVLVCTIFTVLDLYGGHHTSGPHLYETTIRPYSWAGPMYAYCLKEYDRTWATAVNHGRAVLRARWAWRIDHREVAPASRKR